MKKEDSNKIILKESVISLIRFIIHLCLFGVLITDSEVNRASAGAEVQFW